MIKMGSKSFLRRDVTHSWKQKIFHLLVLKDLDGHIAGDRPESEADQVKWDALDAMAQAFLALTLSDQLLETNPWGL